MVRTCVFKREREDKSLTEGDRMCVREYIERVSWYRKGEKGERYRKG